MKKRSAVLVCAVTVLCCTVMALVDGVIRPGYAAKSLIKAAMFMIVPFIASKMDREVRYLSLLRPKKRGLVISVVLGIGIYGLILGGYFLVFPLFDFSKIAGALTENAGVTKDNFLYVSLYISLMNSFLEEFFFRGFVFANLTGSGGRLFACIFSALSFSLYHTAMMIGWFSPLLFAIIMIGLAAGGVIFNFLNEKTETIYCSWLTHMFANLAINTIGFILLA